jgi:hypothetical protein
MENGVEGIEVESKEREVWKAGNGSFNAEDSGSEALGDTLERPNRMNMCQVAEDETNIPRMQGLLGENICLIHESTLNANPGPSGPVRVGLSSAHIHSNNEAEEPSFIGAETDLVIQETQEPSPSLMQTVEFKVSSSPTMQSAGMDQSTKKVAMRTWQRRVRELSTECSMVQGGKRKNSDSLSLSLDDKGSEVKKLRRNNLALAEAGQ